MANKLRIIGGYWRSRCINFIDAPGLRPTPVRVRETAFNWLRNDMMASRCLDLYAGSGALGFEAASRGAKSVSVFTVLRKPDAATVKVEAKYVGFDIPSEFVVGYGLDFNQKYRNLPFIGVLAKHLYS